MTHSLILKLEITALWHMGTGRGSGPDLDAQVFRTPTGLPCIPGRTLKGLLREAVETAERAGVYADTPTLPRSVTWFGSRLPREADNDDHPAEVLQQEARFSTRQGSLRIDTAHPGATLAEIEMWETWARRQPNARNQLFRRVDMTRIDEEGIAADKTLRAIEAVVPMSLFATIHADHDGWQDDLARALLFFDAVGSHRTRGFGRCRASVVLLPAAPAAPAVVPAVVSAALIATPATPSEAEVIGCRWTLRSDVAVTATAATSGSHRTLPYLPGASILGAVARGLYQRDLQWTQTRDLQLFFSGEVRFGSATLEGSAPAPFSLHVPKTEGLDGQQGAWAPVVNLARDTRTDTQYQQVRDRWMMPTGHFVKVARRQSMRTAIGAEGRARDGFLYELDALTQGQVFYSTITVDTGNSQDNAEIAERLRCVLDGRTLGIGRSTQQELGRVEASICKATVNTFAEDPQLAQQNQLVLWCVSDVALVDALGQPTFEPTHSHFHLDESWQWSPERSFVRHRAWSPFRHRRSTTSPAAAPYRQRPGTERNVIAAGSVLVFVRETEIPAFDLATLRKQLRRGVGMYRSEGLGQVLLEPSLLASLPQSPNAPGTGDQPTGDRHTDDQPTGDQPTDDQPPPDSPIVQWATRRAMAQSASLAVWGQVRTMLDELRGVEVPGAAQWGALRAEVLRLQGDAEFRDKLRVYLENSSPPGSQDTPRRRGGPGQRAGHWRRGRVGNVQLVDWLLTLRDGWDDAALSMVLLQLCTWVVRQRRQLHDRGDHT